jgi:hypothetical protein
MTLWQYAFASEVGFDNFFKVLNYLLQDWSPTPLNDIVVPFSELAQVLNHKFLKVTGSKRELSTSDLNYLAEKLHGRPYTNFETAPPITFQRFAKVSNCENLFR